MVCVSVYVIRVRVPVDVGSAGAGVPGISKTLSKSPGKETWVSSGHLSAPAMGYFSIDEA